MQSWEDWAVNCTKFLIKVSVASSLEKPKLIQRAQRFYASYFQILKKSFEAFRKCIIPCT